MVYSIMGLNAVFFFFLEIKLNFVFFTRDQNEKLHSKCKIQRYPLHISEFWRHNQEAILQLLVIDPTTQSIIITKM